MISQQGLIFVNWLFYLFVFWASTSIQANEGIQAKEKIVLASYINGGMQRSALEAQVEIFEQMYPHIEVELELTNGEAYGPKVHSWFDRGEGPDIIFWLGGKRIAQFADRGLLHDIDVLWTKNKLSSVFLPGAIDAVHLNGKAYAIPITYSYLGFYYNPKVFSDAGVSLPQDWEQVMSVCQTLREKDVDLFSFGLKAKWVTHGWFDYLNMRIHGKAFYKEVLDGKVPYTDKRIKLALQHWKQLLDSDCFNSNADRLDRWQAFPRLFHGLSAMTSVEGVPEHVPEPLRKQLRVAPFFSINRELPQYGNASVDIFLVPSYTEMNEHIETFLLFMASAGFQYAFNAPIERLAARSADVEYSSYLVRQTFEIVKSAPSGIQYFDRDTDIAMAGLTPDVFTRFLSHRDVNKTADELEAIRQRVFGDIAE